MTALLVIFVAIIVLVAIANRIGIAYPIVLVIGGMAIGFIPHVPVLLLPPDIVLVVFLPPLLFWESITAPTSEFRANAFWIVQMAFGLVVLTTVVVAFIAHALVPGMGWAVAFVLGAVVSSTDELAFTVVAERLRVPRHIIGTIEGESLINDATSLILYAVAVAAVVGASFSLLHAAGELALSVVESVAIGMAVVGIAVTVWRFVRDETLQGAMSILTPFLAYLPAYYLGASGVLATVTAGIAINRFSPTMLLPRARETLTGFWTTVGFLVNAFIFVEVGIQFRTVIAALHPYSVAQLVAWSLAVAGACVVVRMAWTFALGLLPGTNEPEHVAGKADWSHVAIVGWSGMRGGVSLAAATAIPLETVAGPFPFRSLLIFMTFVVLLVTLVGQGGTLPWLISRLAIRPDTTEADEEHAALVATSKAALDRLDELDRASRVPKSLYTMMKTRYEAMAWLANAQNPEHVQTLSRHRSLHLEILEAQRRRLIELRDRRTIDNTIVRRVQRVLDLQTIEMELLDLEEDGEEA